MAMIAGTAYCKFSNLFRPQRRGGLLSCSHTRPFYFEDAKLVFFREPGK